MIRRHPKRDPGGLDLVLGANEPLGHGPLGDEEGAGDLIRRQPAQRPQCERDLGVERKRRMAAREDELEPFVRDRHLIHLVLRRLRHLEQADLRRERAVAADPVDRPIARGRDQPGARVAGRPLAGPALGGDRERLLGGLLGEVEVAEEADQGGEDASPFVAECLLENRYRSTIGRTSIAPPMLAAGTWAASSIAASRSSASKKR